MCTLSFLSVGSSPPHPAAIDGPLAVEPVDDADDVGDAGRDRGGGGRVLFPFFQLDFLLLLFLLPSMGALAQEPVGLRSDRGDSPPPTKESPPSHP